MQILKGFCFAKIQKETFSGLKEENNERQKLIESLRMKKLFNCEFNSKAHVNLTEFNQFSRTF
jgi:hypothetical protein